LKCLIIVIVNFLYFKFWFESKTNITFKKKKSKIYVEPCIVQSTFSSFQGLLKSTILLVFSPNYRKATFRRCECLSRRKWRVQFFSKWEAKIKKRKI